MNDIFERLRTIKYESEDEIEKTVEGMASEFSGNQKLEKNIIHFFSENAIECKSRGEALIFTVLISFVLADIAGQMSPDLKANNLAKIRYICEKRNINFHLVSSLTACETRLAELIDRCS